MDTLLERLTSRKFIGAVVGAVSLFIAKQYTEAAAVVVGYLAAEGLIDLTELRSRKAELDVVIDDAQVVVDDVLAAADKPSETVL